MSLMIDMILILIGIAALGILVWLGQTLRQARIDRLLDSAAEIGRAHV